MRPSFRLLRPIALLSVLLALAGCNATTDPTAPVTDPATKTPPVGSPAPCTSQSHPIPSHGGPGGRQQPRPALAEAAVCAETG
jgi:hypothetical protein